MIEQFVIRKPSKDCEIVDVMIEPREDDVDPVAWAVSHVLTGTVAELLEETRVQLKREADPDVLDWPTASIVIYDRFDHSEIARGSVAD